MLYIQERLLTVDICEGQEIGNHDAPGYSFT